MHNLWVLILLGGVTGCLEPLPEQSSRDGGFDAAREVADEDRTDGGVVDAGRGEVALTDANGRTDAEYIAPEVGEPNPYPDGRDPDAGSVLTRDAGSHDNDSGVDENGRPIGG